MKMTNNKLKHCRCPSLWIDTRRGQIIHLGVLEVLLVQLVLCPQDQFEDGHHLRSRVFLVLRLQNSFVQFAGDFLNWELPVKYVVRRIYSLNLHLQCDGIAPGGQQRGCSAASRRPRGPGCVPVRSAHPGCSRPPLTSATGQRPRPPRSGPS